MCADILCFSSVIASTIWTFWYGMHSDRDDISPFLNRLMPAGHCACETATLFECSSCLNPPRRPFLGSKLSIPWEYEYQRDGQNQGLTEDQCNDAFPGLYEDVNRGMKYWYSHGNITQQTLDDIPLDNGMTRAMIYEGNLYVIACNQGDEGEGMSLVRADVSIGRTGLADQLSIALRSSSASLGRLVRHSPGSYIVSFPQIAPQHRVHVCLRRQTG